VSVILAVQKADSTAAQVSVWAAILAIHVVLWFVMRYSLLIIRIIKDGGVVLVTRLAGMMLSAIAVQQIINGVTQVVRGGGPSRARPEPPHPRRQVGYGGRRPAAPRPGGCEAPRHGPPGGRSRVTASAYPPGGSTDAARWRRPAERSR